MPKTYRGPARLAVLVGDNMYVAAVVLAAGKSERMGQNKLLLRLNDHTLVESVLDAAAVAGVHTTVVVLGHAAQELIGVLATRREVQIVINPEYWRGMVSSFQQGLRRARDADAAFLMLGDQPILDKNLSSAMIDELADNPETLIVSPSYAGKKGHPVLFRAELFTEIFALDAPDTIREIVHRHKDRLLTIDAPEWTVMDVDTPDDYARILALVRKDL
ncbi:MAG TPA: nucleotidyltransferase family protein [Candidatus Bathyarchaeia archaeon]|nr:nucleotidyltransferase family protein [Candidatus Bathyarchaeia archaeon]